jgi:hypothetical protein
MFGAPSYIISINSNEIAARRSERSLSFDKRDRIAQALEKLRTETRTALIGGWSSLRIIHPGDLSDSSLRLALGNDVMDEAREQQIPAAPVTAAAVDTTTSMPTSRSTPPPAQVVGGGTPFNQNPADGTGQEPSSRTLHDPVDSSPIGSQKTPAGSLNGPLYFLGTSAISSYCVNYYQFRVLVAESRLQKIIKSNGLGSNRLAPQLSQHRGGIITAAATLQQRVANANGRDMLHLTVKLTDTSGRFFKGFSLLEHARSLDRVMNDFAGPSSLPASTFGGGPAIGLNEPMVELTMLLNSTRPEPIRIGEAIVSYYFHQIVLADRIEINYMSNISPDVRGRYSSVLCPVAINDRHQLVRYIECQKVTPVR